MGDHALVHEGLGDVEGDRHRPEDSAGQAHIVADALVVGFRHEAAQRGEASAHEQFEITNLNSLSGSFYASDTIGGPASTNAALGSYFDWGLPFFYGKTVFTAIEGKTAGSATGPYVAY